MSADVEFRGPMEWLAAIIDHMDTPSPAQFKVLSCLARTLDWKSGTGYASEPYLAVMSGIGTAGGPDRPQDVRTVHAALNWAREHGFAIRTRKGHRVNHMTSLASEWRLTRPSQQDIERTVGTTGQQDIERTVGTAELGLRPNPTRHSMQANTTLDVANTTLNAPPSSLSSLSLSASSLSCNTRPTKDSGEEKETARADVGGKGSGICNDYWVQTSGKLAGFFTKVTQRKEKQGEVLVSLTTSEASRFWKMDRQDQVEYMLGRARSPQPESRPQADDTVVDQPVASSDGAARRWYVDHESETYRLAVGRARPKRGEIEFEGSIDDLMDTWPYLQSA
jgi:hypothetical protein